MTRQRCSEQVAQRALRRHLIFRIANLLHRVSADCSVRVTKVQVFFITSTIINVSVMVLLSDKGLLSQLAVS